MELFTISLQVLFARMTSAVCLAFLVGLFLNKKYYAKDLDKILDNHIVALLGGVVAICYGITILSIEDGNAEPMLILLVKIAGWESLAKGIMLLAMPSFAAPIMHFFLRADNQRKFLAPLLLIVGAVYAYFGFYAV